MSETAHLVAKIASLRQELQQFETLLTRKATPRSPEIKAMFERVDGERRPFVIRFGESFPVPLPVSTVRAAILLVLLLDLENRAEGGKGILDTTAAITEVYQAIEMSSAESASAAYNRVRVALYRFAETFEDNPLSTGQGYELRFSPEDNRLYPQQPEEQLPTVTVSTSDPQLSALIDVCLDASPLVRLRKQKALFIPEGHEGYDRLLLELVDHRLPVRIKSMYSRPATYHSPLSILEKAGVSANKLTRRTVTLTGLRSGRCQHLEILSRQAIWDLIRVDGSGRFVAYAASDVLQDEVRDHLMAMIEAVTNYKGYELILTDSVFPFIMTSFTIGPADTEEHYTLLYQDTGVPESQVSAFAVTDAHAFRYISEPLLQSASRHPTSIRSKAESLVVLEQVLNHLETEGPLSMLRGPLGS